MARKKKEKKGATPEVVKSAEPAQELTPQSVSTRNLERPKGSIRIVPGRKDAQ